MLDLYGIQTCTFLTFHVVRLAGTQASISASRSAPDVVLHSSHSMTSSLDTCCLFEALALVAGTCKLRFERDCSATPPSAGVTGTTAAVMAGKVDLRADIRFHVNKCVTFNDTDMSASSDMKHTFLDVSSGWSSLR